MGGKKMDGYGKVKKYNKIQDDEFILDMGKSTIKKIIPQNFGLIFDGKSTVILIYVYLL